MSLTLRLALTLLGCVAIGLPGLGAQQVSVPAEYAVVHRLVHEAYPELTSQRVSLSLSMTGNDVIVSVSEPRAFLRRPTAPAPPALVDARVTVSTDRRVIGLTARGALLEGGKNEALADAIEANPDWSDTQLRAWLAAQGGAYGPNRVLNAAEKINPARWRTLLGEGLFAWDVRFQWREAGGRGVATRAKAGWTARVSALSADQRGVSYRLRFEPFSGRLVEIREQ